MTRTYTAKLEIRCWKAHTCLGCGGRFAYLMCRKLAHGGSTPERATEKVRAAAQRAMASDVDRRPCPTCGLYQPDMIALRRRSWHRWLLPAALLAMGLAAGLYLGHVLQADRALFLAMGTVAVIGALGFFIDLRNPNRNLEANRGTAEQEIAAGRLRLLQPGMPLGPDFGPPATGLYGLLAFGLAAAGLLALAAPELMRRERAWPLNAECYPSVAGPGDETCVYLPDSVSSIKGYWAGKARVTAQVVRSPVPADDGPAGRALAPRQAKSTSGLPAGKPTGAIRSRPRAANNRLPIASGFA